MHGRRVCVAVMLLTLPMTASILQARAAGCAALDYQAGLTSAGESLQQTPADVADAARVVTMLLSSDPSSAPALQPVLDDLTASPPELDDAKLRLASMSATLAYPRGSVCNENAGAARNALHGVYASPELRHLDDSAEPGWLTTVFNFLARLLGGAAGALGPFGAALLAVAVVVAAMLVGWRRWHGSAGLRGASIDEPATAGDDPQAEWRAAQRAASAGDYREATRRAFRSALLEISARGRLHIDAAWTTRELLQRCHADGDVLVALAAAAALFERAWYSGAVVTAEDWTRAEDRCATVRRLARHAGAPAR
jgi:hypothetical protein